MSWFRFYAEAIQDRKLRRLPPAHRWLWVAVLCAAKESPEPGRLVIHTGLPMTAEDLADEAAISVEEVRDGLNVFQHQGMVHMDGETYVVTNWDKRQFTNDSSKERTQRYRQNLREQGVTVTGYTKHREQVYERDEHRCVYCGSTKNLCLDHAVPVSLGGDEHPDNLFTACKACNSGKSGRTPEMANMTFISQEASDLYKSNLSRLRREPVTVTVTPPEYRVQSTDLKDSGGGDAYPHEVEVRIQRCYERTFGTLPNEVQISRLSLWHEKGMELELILSAIVKARERGKDFGYVLGTLNRQYERGIRTLAHAEQDSASLEIAVTRSGTGGIHSNAGPSTRGPNGRTRSITDGKFGRV